MSHVTHDTLTLLLYAIHQIHEHWGSFLLAFSPCALKTLFFVELLFRDIRVICDGLRLKATMASMGSCTSESLPILEAPFYFFIIR
jgi:hypothetical protein